MRIKFPSIFSFTWKKAGKAGVGSATVPEHLPESDSLGAGFPDINPEELPEVSQKPSGLFGLRLPSSRAGKPVEAVFGDDFVIGSRTVAKSDIKTTIRGIAEDNNFGSDYYFLYRYEGGGLSYLILSGNTHVAGKTTVFAPAFFEEGSYVYQDGPRYFVVTNKNGKLEAHSLPHPPDIKAIELNDDRIGLPANASNSMLFEWSLAKRFFYAELACVVVFGLSVVFHGTSLRAYNAVERRAEDIRQQEIASANAPKPVMTTMDLGAAITDVRYMMEPYFGAIESVKIEKGKVLMALSFANDSYTRMFLAKHGGKYENGKVLLSNGGAGGGNPNPGNQGSQKPEGGQSAGQPANSQASQPGPGQTGNSK